MKAFWVQLFPVNPGTNQPVPLLLTSYNSVDGTMIETGQIYLPYLESFPTTSMTIFDGEFTGHTEVTIDKLEISAAPFDVAGKLSYVWDGAVVRIFKAEIGTFVKGSGIAGLKPVFEGVVRGSPAVEGDIATIDLVDKSYLMEVNALSLVYLGFGGVEGPEGLKGTYKPLAIGTPIAVAPILVDPAYLSYQYHGYGFSGGVYNLSENGILFGPAKSVTGWAGSVADTYNAFKNVALNLGEWADCPSIGMFRLGGEPSANGVIVADVKGALDAGGNPINYCVDAIKYLVRTTRIADAINADSLSTFQAAIGNLSVSDYISAQAQIGECVAKYLIGAGGYYFFDSRGRLSTGLIRTSDVEDLTVLSDGTSTPLVEDIKSSSISAPYKTVRLGAQQCFRVHDNSEISDALIQAAAGAPAGSFVAGVEASQLVARVNSALAQLATIQMDGILNRSEKPDMIIRYDSVVAERPKYAAQANPRNISIAAYDQWYNAVVNYFSNLGDWRNLGTDTPLPSSPRLTDLFYGYYDAQVALQMAISTVDGQTALWDGVGGQGKIDLIAKAAAADANAASALARLTNIASDNVLAIEEKPNVTAKYNDIVLERQGIINQANAIGVSSSAFSGKFDALAMFMGNISPPYFDTSASSTIDGAGFIRAFADYYEARSALYNAMTQKNYNEAQIAAGAAATASANAASVVAAIANLYDDGKLTPNEKSDLLVQLKSIDQQYGELIIRASTRSDGKPWNPTIPTFDLTNQYNALYTYLNGLNPSYTNLNTTTTFVKDDFATKLANYVQFAQRLANDIAVAALQWSNSLGDSKPEDGSTAGANLIRYSDTLLRTLTVGGAVKEFNASSGGANRDRNRVRFPAGGGFVAAYWEPTPGMLKVVPGETLYAQFSAYFTSGVFRFVIQFTDSNLNVIANPFIDVYSNGQGAWRTIGNIAVTVPNGAAGAYVYSQFYNGNQDAFAADPIVQKIQPGADTTSLAFPSLYNGIFPNSFDTRVSQTAKFNQLDPYTGQLVNRRGTTQFSLGGGQQVVLVLDEPGANANGVPMSPLRATYNPNTGVSDIYIRPHRIADDAGYIEYPGALLSGIQNNLDVWIFEDSNYVGGPKNYQVTQEAIILAGQPNPAPNRRLVGAIRTPQANQPPVMGNGGGGGGVRASVAKYNLE